jgi:hypothetical protein
VEFGTEPEQPMPRMRCYTLWWPPPNDRPLQAAEPVTDRGSRPVTPVLEKKQ